MESEFLNEQVEWEARRVAAAFNEDNWKVEKKRHPTGSIIFYGLWVMWIIEPVIAKWVAIRVRGMSKELSTIYDKRWYISGSITTPYWLTTFHPSLNELMVRGLYRLGFDDEDVLAQLPHLTAHEKIELRLSMPREFWPQKWLDEVG